MDVLTLNVKIEANLTSTGSRWIQNFEDDFGMPNEAARSSVLPPAL